MDGKELVRQIEMRISELGMKKKDFYALTGISSAAFSYWNTGRSQPSLDALTKIDAVLGTSFKLSQQNVNPRGINASGVFLSVFNGLLESVLILYRTSLCPKRTIFNFQNATKTQSISLKSEIVCDTARVRVQCPRCRRCRFPSPMLPLRLFRHLAFPND